MKQNTHHNTILEPQRIYQLVHKTHLIYFLPDEAQNGNRKSFFLLGMDAN